MKKKKPILYLGVDGVLLTYRAECDKNGHAVVRPRVKEFLEYATRQFQCRWLTSWYQGKDQNHIAFLCKNYLRPAGVTPETLSEVIPYGWRSGNAGFLDKVNSIDVRENFYLVDDRISLNELPMEYRHRFINLHPTRQNELEKAVKVLGQIVDGTHGTIARLQIENEELRRGQEYLLQGHEAVLAEAEDAWTKKERSYLSRIKKLEERCRAV